jgi:hypothetical protein
MLTINTSIPLQVIQLYIIVCPMPSPMFPCVQAPGLDILCFYQLSRVELSQTVATSKCQELCLLL